MANLNPFDENGPIRVKRNDPLGTVEELRKQGLNPAEYASCARRQKDADGNWEVVGCPLRADCERLEKEGRGIPRQKFVNEKGEHVAAGTPGAIPEGPKLTAGPINLGLRYIKQTPSGKKIVIFPDSCMGYAARKAGCEMNGILDVIAIEGETIKTRGSTFEDVTVPGEGLKRVVTDRTDVPYLIPFFPRPHENPTLAAEIFASEQVDTELTKRKDAQREKALGMANRK